MNSRDLPDLPAPEHVPTRILAPRSKGPGDPALAEAGRIIRQGGRVVFPTETVWGLGADARNGRAAEGIYRAKGRPSDNPLIVHVHSLAAARACTPGMNRLTRVLADRYWPGPVTLICPRSDLIAPRTCAGMDTVGIRIPAMPLARDFLEACDCPVAAPSANRSGRPSPTDSAMAREEMEGRVEAILEGPEATLGLESSILFAPDDATVHLLRAGSLDPRGILRDLAIDGFSGVTLWYRGQKIDSGAGFPDSPGADPAEASPGTPASGDALPAAPGTRYRHYSPEARVHVWTDPGELAALLASLDLPRTGWLGCRESGVAPPAGLAWYREYPDPEAYGQGLYRSLREADHRGIADLLAWVPGGHGAFRTALRDRLERASGG